MPGRTGSYPGRFRSNHGGSRIESGSIPHRLLVDRSRSDPESNSGSILARLPFHREPMIDPGPISGSILIDLGSTPGRHRIDTRSILDIPRVDPTSIAGCGSTRGRPMSIRIASGLTPDRGRLWVDSGSTSIQARIGSNRSKATPGRSHIEPTAGRPWVKRCRPPTALTAQSSVDPWSIPGSSATAGRPASTPRRCQIDRRLRIGPGPTPSRSRLGSRVRVAAGRPRIFTDPG